MGRTETPASAGDPPSSEWLLVRGRRRAWLLLGFLPVTVLLLLYRVAQWVLDGWGWDVALGLLLVVSFAGFLTTQWRPRTRAVDDGLLIRGEFTRQKLVRWHTIRDINAEGGRWATAVTAHLADGRSVVLPGVRPEEVDSVLAARGG